MREIYWSSVTHFSTRLWILSIHNSSYTPFTYCSIFKWCKVCSSPRLTILNSIINLSVGTIQLLGVFFGLLNISRSQDDLLKALEVWKSIVREQEKQNSILRYFMRSWRPKGKVSWKHDPHFNLYLIIELRIIEEFFKKSIIFYSFSIHVDNLNALHLQSLKRRGKKERIQQKNKSHNTYFKFTLFITIQVQRILFVDGRDLTGVV